jgi:hypothetical protein
MKNMFLLPHRAERKRKRTENLHYRGNQNP